MTDIEKQLAEIHSVLNAIRDESKMLLKMQKSILQGQKHYHIVGGYVWGNTAEGASFLVLYPKSEKLKEKVCRVYADDYQFTDIPDSIRATQENTGLDTPKDKEWAQKKGVYHVCPAMGVITADGKETQMGHEKRFAGVLWVSKGRQDRPAPAAPTPPPSVEKNVPPLPPLPAPPAQPKSEHGNGNGQTAASKEFNSIPGKSAAGIVDKATDHQLQRIKEEAARIYGPTWADDGNEKKLAQFITKGVAETFTALNKEEAKSLIDALLRRANHGQPKQTA